MKRLAAALICVVVINMAAFAQNKPAADAEDAEAKKTFETVCSQCHELSQVTERRALHDVWTKVVRRMDAEGAGASAAQYLSIIDYLTRHYGPERLNVNEASAEDFVAFFAISPSDAEAIVKYRASNGKYKTMSDILKSGADRNSIESKKDTLAF